MDWDTALRRVLRHFNARARRQMAKRQRESREIKPPKPVPTAREAAARKILDRARRNAARQLKARIQPPTV